MRHSLKNDENKVSSISTHLLVARLFLHNSNPKENTQVNHIDEDKTNPCVLNLEWVSPIQNSNHGTRNKRISKQMSKPINEYDLDGNYIRTWKSSLYVSKVYPITCRVIQSAAIREEDKNKTDCQTAYGRQWRYLENDNINNIKPITKKHIRQYNKNVNHNDFIVPNEYIYEVKPINKKDKCLNIINDIMNDKAFSTYYLLKIKELEDYIVQQEGV